MDLHVLLGQQPGSVAIDSVLQEASRRAIGGSIMTVPVPTIKVYKDAVYYSYLPLGISLNFEPCALLIPSEYPANTSPDSSILSLAAIHLYRNPVDKFETFPLSFVLHLHRMMSGRRTSEEEPRPTDQVIAVEASATSVEMDVNKQAHEVVQLLGEPEQRVGGGRQGSCWIGYQKTVGLAVDFAGTSWEDREMGIASVTITRPGSEV